MNAEAEDFKFWALVDAAAAEIAAAGKARRNEIAVADARFLIAYNAAEARLALARAARDEAALNYAASGGDSPDRGD